MRAKIWAEKDRLAKMQMLDEEEAALRREKDEKNMEVSWG
jgi:CRISPR/Cas system CMR-associated protein Cmr1 (group 7 of RAMP superfamily)